MPTVQNDPALLVTCPLCHAPRGEFCRSRHAVAIHVQRRGALRDLEREATRILRRGRL